jgi:fatty-acyl-CoA synthase
MTDSYARGDTSAAMLDETIGANLERAVERFGEREALISCAQGRHYTYAELGAAVDELARALMAAGLATGDRIGIWSPNCVEWTLVQYATAKLGAILVNINPAYRTSELEYALKQSDCRMLVAAPAFKTSDYEAMIAQVRPSLPELQRVVLLDSPDWDELMAGAPEVSADELRTRSDALAPDDPSTSSTPAARPAFPRARHSRTATSSTTATSWGRAVATPRRTGSASRCRSTTASGW